MQLSLTTHLRAGLAICAASILTGCATVAPPVELVGGVPANQIVEGYGVLNDGDYTLPPIPPEYLQGVNQRAIVSYAGDEGPGTIVVDPHAKLLYLVEEDGLARRYPIAVGRQGLRMSATTTIRLKREWPSWTPTQNMLRTQPEVYGPFAQGVEGGLASPLGSRALYLFRNGRDTHFRIHGTNDLASIGNSGSAGCIRLFNHDIIDLYPRVDLGTRVVVRTFDELVALEGEALATRGIELQPNIIDPDVIYGTDDRDVEDDADVIVEVSETSGDALSSGTISGG